MSFFSEYWKGGEGQTEASFHSLSYHSFFEGYVEKKELDPRTGRVKWNRIYTAPYYVRRGTDAQWKRSKLLTAALYLLSGALLFLSSTVLELTAPAKLYQCILAIGYLCAFYTLYVVIHFLAAPRKMTIGEHRAISPKLEKSSLVSSVCIFAALAARIASAALSAGSVTGRGWLGFFCLALSGASMLAINRMEHASGYETEDNPRADEHGYQVQR